MLSMSDPNYKRY